MSMTPEPYYPVIGATPRGRMVMQDLEGRTAVVTGAASGIGRALVQLQLDVGVRGAEVAHRGRQRPGLRWCRRSPHG